jgi:hypothetical protein
MRVVFAVMIFALGCGDDEGPPVCDPLNDYTQVEYYAEVEDGRVIVVTSPTHGSSMLATRH